jgi:hypothetical protein
MAPPTRTLLSTLTAALTLAAAGPALAAPPVGGGAPVHVAAQDAADSCGFRSVAVARWVPSLGPAARFIVADPTRFVALGRTDDGFWSTQWTTPGDACDDCGHLDLVFTRFADGRSTRYPVLREEDRRAFDSRPDAGSPAWSAAREAALRDLMLQRLWRYAATVWPVATLRHDYAVVTPKEDPAGTPAPYRGWLVGIVQGGRSRLRFTTDMAHSMCWCFESWRSFVPGR